MATTGRRYPKEEFVRRGDETYEKKVLPHLTKADFGKFAAVDIESGAFEVHEDEMAASDRLRSRFPDAQIWFVRIGSPYLHRIGGSRLDAK